MSGQHQTVCTSTPLSRNAASVPLPWWPQGGGEFRADSTDDTGWWGLAMVRAYDLTHRKKYLDIAELDEQYMSD